MPTYDQMIDQEVYDNLGDKIGKIDGFYVNEGSNTPDWIAIKTGFFGNRISFVPLEAAEPTEDGIRVNFTKDQVKSAPNVEADGEIGPDEETELYNYYHQIDTFESDTTKHSDTDDEEDDDDINRQRNEGAMTRSEEEVNVDKQQVETGRVRLKKYVVTENVNFTVPLRKEKVRVNREPITDANKSAALSGPDISEGEHEEVIYEEQLSVDKKVVPKERISLDKEVTQDEEQVNEEVRKEQVDVEGDDRR